MGRAGERLVSTISCGCFRRGSVGCRCGNAVITCIHWYIRFGGGGCTLIGLHLQVMTDRAVGDGVAFGEPDEEQYNFVGDGAFDSGAINVSKVGAHDAGPSGAARGRNRHETMAGAPEGCVWGIFRVACPTVSRGRTLTKCRLSVVCFDSPQILFRVFDGDASCDLHTPSTPPPGSLCTKRWEHGNVIIVKLPKNRNA